MSDTSSITSIPVAPVRDMVVFPYMIAPLRFQRPASIRALEQSMESDGRVLLVTQRDPLVEEPTPDDLYSVGVIADARQVVRLPDGEVRLIIEGVSRARIEAFTQQSPFLSAVVTALAEQPGTGREVEALTRRVRQQFAHIAESTEEIPDEVLLTVDSMEDPGMLADIVISYLVVELKHKQAILETVDPRQRLDALSRHLAHELEIVEIDRQLDDRIRQEVGSTQKEYYLRERMRAIQEELGEEDVFTEEIENLRQQIEAARMPAEARERAFSELSRLERMPPVAPESVVIRTYLDWLIALPWRKRTRDRLDIEAAQAVLDEDHYGLAQVKERVIEFLAVRQLNPKSRGPILCFIGPPGVGKTSIGRSIARAMGRKFIRLSLGGIHDEAEIRGHRRTYIGALPGRIIQTIKRVGCRNPVFMLDEIDKVGADFRGDPSAALLEALDPEQNREFSDHYLEVAFDLSQVMFIATGNLSHPIPPALRDRMEIIEFPSYTEQEKLCIARQFLAPKQIGENGLQKSHITFTTAGLQCLIGRYTREAGVRQLERVIGAVCRKVARRVASGDSRRVRLTPGTAPRYLGPEKFAATRKESEDSIAVATGLSWSECGGDILAVEASLLAGKGELQLTGQLGDVMQESARAAVSYARARASRYGVDAGRFADTDIHIHVPAGATPKDGPSAGITMAVALMSALTGRPVRRDLALTGEITLRGKILPVGGVKEKVLAAHRTGIFQVALPVENDHDLADVPDEVRKDMEFHLIEHADQALELALRPAAATPAAEGRPDR